MSGQMLTSAARCSSSCSWLPVCRNFWMQPSLKLCCQLDIVARPFCILVRLRSDGTHAWWRRRRRAVISGADRSKVCDEEEGGRFPGRRGRPASCRLRVIQAPQADKHIKVITVLRRRRGRSQHGRNFLHQRSFDGFYQRLKAAIQANNRAQKQPASSPSTEPPPAPHFHR